MGYASSVPISLGTEHVENVLHVLFQQAAKPDVIAVATWLRRDASATAMF